MKVTAGVTRTTLVAAVGPGMIKADRFHYPPGGHTHWHEHTGEQVLYGESGRGWVQFHGEERVDLEPGTAIAVPVGVRHWHGAVPDEGLVHVAVTAGGDTRWLGEVTHEEYLGDTTGDAGQRPTSPDAVVRSFIAAIARADLDTALRLVSDDVVYDNVPIGPVSGPDGIRTALARVLSVSERVEWVTHHQVAQGTRVMNERLDRFLIGGRWVEVPVAGLFIVEDSRIVLWRDYFDLASYRDQLRTIG